MNALVVYYDSRCGLCLAVRDWIGRQRQLIPVECRPKSPDMDELVVVADTGEVWSGDTAWLMVLWALVGSPGSRDAVGAWSRPPSSARKRCSSLCPGER